MAKWMWSVEERSVLRDPYIWLDGKKRFWALIQLTDDHLQSIIKSIEDGMPVWGQRWKLNWLVAEAQRRGLTGFSGRSSVTEVEDPLAAVKAFALVYFKNAQQE